MKINTFRRFYHHAIRAFEANIEGMIYLRLLNAIPKQENKSPFEVYAKMIKDSFIIYQEKIEKMISQNQINKQETAKIIGVIGKFENTLNELEAKRLEKSIDFEAYSQKIETAFFGYKKENIDFMQEFAHKLINGGRNKNESKTGNFKS